MREIAIHKKCYNKGMRRKQKKLLKKIITVVFIVAVVFGLVKTGTLDGMLSSFKGLEKSIKGTISSTTEAASSGVENLRKLYEEYIAENGGEGEIYSPTKASGVTQTVTETKTRDGVTATHGIVVTERLEGLEIPSYITKHPVVQKLGYALSYNLEYVQPDWVAYTLDIEELNTTTTSRSDEFYEELDVLPGSAKLSDYRRSGYDRGHLLSSANRTSSEDLNISTFSLLNMSPQIHRFNAGLFLKAEDAERDAARQYGILYIVTGPVFSNDMDTIGDSKVAVPKAFYKVFLGQDSDGVWHAIGMILPQEYENGNLKPYFVTVDDVEKATGIDFYPSLDNAIERVVEAEYDLSYWPKSFR